MAQVSYGTVTITDLTDITDMFLQYGLALANASVTNSYSFSGTNERGWYVTTQDTTVIANKIYFQKSGNIYKIVLNPTGNPKSSGWYESAAYPTWISGYQIWIREVKIKEGVDLPEYGTPYLDTAVNQVNNNIINLDNKLQTFFWPGDSNYPGAFAVSKTESEGLVTTNANTYGWNTRVGVGSISMGYNTIPLLELGLLDSGNFNGLRLYSPILTNSVVTGNRLDATLDSNGLVLSQGGISAGTSNTNNYVYLSSIDGPFVPINDFTPDSESDEPRWRQIIGTKFGVLSDGTLYASNVNVSGTINATVGQIGGAVITDGLLQITKANISDKLTANEIDVDTLIATGQLATTGQINAISNNGNLNWNNGVLTISASPYSVEIGGTGIKFKYNESTPALIDQDKLKIGKTVVLNEMQLGENKWSWKIDPIDNYIYLKWMGE